MRKICITTGSRAEYGLLYRLMKEIENDPGLELQIIVTGMHLMSQYGLTFKQIEKDGYNISSKVEMPLESDSSIDVSRSIGVGVSGFASAFDELKPDIVVVLGDRYEMFSAAVAATIGRFPIAHIHGGETTEGAFDEALRHSITKMSYLHFAAADAYRKRIIQMGESPDRVFNVGALGVENIRRTKLLTREEVEASLGFRFSYPTFLVTYHPVTLEDRTSSHNIAGLLKALDGFPNAKVIFTHSNSDPDNMSIRQAISEFVKASGGRSMAFDSLGSERYINTLRYVDVIIGNSSSGVIEAPALRKATVNIGIRQKGRLMASSVIQCNEDPEDITRSIKIALSQEFKLKLGSFVHPYGSGDVSTSIINILKSAKLDGNCLVKGFHDL